MNVNRVLLLSGFPVMIGSVSLELGDCPPSFWGYWVDMANVGREVILSDRFEKDISRVGYQQLVAQKKRFKQFAGSGPCFAVVSTCKGSP